MTIIDPVRLGKQLRAEATASADTLPLTQAAGSNLCPACGDPLTPMVVSTKFDGDGKGKLPVLVCLKDAIAVPDYSTK